MENLNGERILIGLSEGINSAALICHLVELGIKPAEVHLYCAHFAEHSPDSFKFAKALIRYARKHFDKVVVKITSNHVLRYFEEQNMIPHPRNSPCSKNLKILAMKEYAFNNGIKIDLVGYVKEEIKRRAGRAKEYIIPDMFSAEKFYPIGEFTDEWCFSIVDRCIGFHPAIYDILDDNGKRVFKHNNCLPCKNMTIKNMESVKKYYPQYHAKAMELSEKLKKYWGRDEAEFYSTFGRELGQDSSCESCQF